MFCALCQVGWVMPVLLTLVFDLSAVFVLKLNPVALFLARQLWLQIHVNASHTRATTERATARCRGTRTVMAIRTFASRAGIVMEWDK